MLEIKKINDVTMAYGTTGPKGSAMSVAVYVIDGLLIDTGSQSLLPDFIPFFKANDFEKAVLTHYHEDHSGGAKWLQEHLAIPLYCNPISVETFGKEAEYPEYRHAIWGAREAFKAVPLEEAFSSRKEKWRAIFTPGHAFDHLVFLNESRGAVFSGDLYVTPRTKLMLREESVPEIIDSIHRLLEFDFGEIYCSHAGHIPNGKEMFRRKLEYLENLQGKVIQMDQKGWTAAEIQQSLFPRKYPLIDISEGEWDSLHIITSILKRNGSVYE
ncbi:MBL fold metallo-hydrolase [Bacillus massiliglaciei]|uniref:MBL fold metallo-hydrolase n=1 Tax=Bacillus massiliglaciei TaxID=1816693 RepID=UPI000AF532C0|nr:MBL fold metallo-hydrolase [Bacillus massiliglaciei]